jgi:hypothetical protein
MPIALDGCTWGRGFGAVESWTPGVPASTSASELAGGSADALPGSAVAFTPLVASTYGPCSLGVDAAGSAGSVLDAAGGDSWAATNPPNSKHAANALKLCR